MAKNFRSNRPKKPSPDSIHTQAESQGFTLPDPEQINKYASMSEGDLMSSLLSSVQKGRENGSLANADLDSMFANVSPMLSPEQRTKMRSLINMLKTK